MLRSLLLSVLLFLGLFSAKAQELRFYQINEFEEYEQVLLMALEESKMIFAVVYENNGVFEDMVRQDIFQNDSLAVFYDENTIPIAVNITSNMGARLVETFGTEDLPVFYYFTDEELLVLLRSGFQDAPALISALAEAQAKAENYAELQEKYGKEELSTGEWIRLLEISGLNFSYVRTMRLAQQFFASVEQSELLSDSVRPMLLQYGLDLETPYPELVIQNKEKLDSGSFSEYYSSVYSYNFDRAVANQDSVLMEKIISSLIPHAPGSDTSLEKMVFETKKVFAADAKVFHVWRDAALERSKMHEDDSLRAHFIFEEAFEIADNFNTEKAKKAAMQLANEASALDEEFRYKMLEGYMAYLLEDYDKAETLVNEAETLVENPQNQSKAQGLLRMIQREKAEAQNEENEE